MRCLPRHQAYARQRNSPISANFVGWIRRFMPHPTSMPTRRLPRHQAYWTVG
ncbi:hypothetical protein ACLK1T_09795 [Escherichia coli]